MVKKTNEISVKFFDQEIVDKVSSFLGLDESDKTKDKILALKNELKAKYKELDLAIASEIKLNLEIIKKNHNCEMKAIDENMEKALQQSSNSNSDDLKSKKTSENLSDEKKGIETVAKRARIKERNAYVENIKNEKMRRSDLHTEFVSIKCYLDNRVSAMDSLRSKYLESKANFNLHSKLTNKKFWIGLVPLAMLIMIIAAYYIGRSITGYQGDLTDIINKGIFVAVVATGAVFIYSQGGFDMSLGNSALMCATIAAIMYNQTHNLAISLLVAVVVGACLGIINAIFATILNLPVMVMTLTMMNIIAAVHEAILGNYGGLVSVDGGMISSAWIYAIFLLVFFALCWFIFNYTKVGRRNKFIGSNKVAARFNGINLMRAGIISFAISGIGLGICGFLFACSKSGGKYGASTILSQVGLDVVIAIVLGGMTTSGGPKSKVSCAIIGAFFAVFLDEFFNAISTPTFLVGNYCFMVKGIIFIVVSVANMWDTRGKNLASGGSIQ